MWWLVRCRCIRRRQDSSSDPPDPPSRNASTAVAEREDLPLQEHRDSPLDVALKFCFEPFVDVGVLESSGPAAARERTAAILSRAADVVANTEVVTLESNPRMVQAFRTVCARTVDLLRNWDRRIMAEEDYAGDQKASELHKTKFRLLQFREEIRTKVMIANIVLSQDQGRDDGAGAARRRKTAGAKKGTTAGVSMAGGKAVLDVEAMRDAKFREILEKPVNVHQLRRAGLLGKG